MSEEENIVEQPPSPSNDELATDILNRQMSSEQSPENEQSVHEVLESTLKKMTQNTDGTNKEALNQLITGVLDSVAKTSIDDENPGDKKDPKKKRGLTNDQLVIFKTITNFVSDLNECFGNKQKSLALYNRLIEKTTFVHEKAIKNHINVFYNFYKVNSDAIAEKDINKMANHVIQLNERVYINLQHIFKTAARDEKEAIWDHLLALGALLDPAGKAKEILRQKKEKGEGGNEEEFVSKIIENVEQNFRPGANPQEIVSSLLSGGFIQNMVGSMNDGLSNGELDMGKLMGTVQNMLVQLGEENGNPDEMQQVQGMVNTMMTNFGPMMGMMNQAQPPQ